jgi:hypothetical protein
MYLAVSITLLVMVLWFPLAMLAGVLRGALNAFDAFFSKSLVEGKGATRIEPGATRRRNAIMGWIGAVVIFLFFTASLPPPPEVEQDRTRERIERLYDMGINALRIEYADSLLSGLRFDETLVRAICRGVPPVVHGSHEYSLRCTMLQNALVGISVVDKGREVFTGTWVLP